MALITQKKEKKITLKEQTINLDTDTIKAINEYCRLFGITKGTAEERREFFIKESIKIVLYFENDKLEKIKEENKK